MTTYKCFTWHIRENENRTRDAPDNLSFLYLVSYRIQDIETGYKVFYVRSTVNVHLFYHGEQYEQVKSRNIYFSLNILTNYPMKNENNQISGQVYAIRLF